MPIINNRTARDPQEGRLENWAEEACDQIDAGFFSADTFHSPEAILRIEYYLSRWQRELARIKAMPDEDG
jgi:hypothetical protein